VNRPNYEEHESGEIQYCGCGHKWLHKFGCSVKILVRPTDLEFVTTGFKIPKNS